MKRLTRTSWDGRSRGKPSESRRARLLGLLAVLFVAATVLDALDWSWLVGKGNTLSTLIGVLFLIAYTLVRGPKFSLPRGERLWFTVFVLWTLFAEVVHSQRLGGTMAATSTRYYFSYAQVFVLYLLMRDVMNDPRIRRRVINTFVITYIVVAVLADMEVRGGYERATALGRNANGLAFFFGLSAVILFSMLLADDKRPRWKTGTFLGAIMLFLISMARTGSRGGALAMTVGLVIVTVSTVNLRKAPRYLVLVPLFFAAGLYAAMSSPVFVERAMMAIHGENLGGRPELAEGAWILIREEPIVGVGPAYVWRLGAITGMGGRRPAHNGFLQIAVSFGIPGLLLFLRFVWECFKPAWRNRMTPDGAVALAVFTTLMGFFMTSNTGYGKLTWVLFAIVASTRQVDVLGHSVLEARGPHLASRRSVRGFERGRSFRPVIK